VGNADLDELLGEGLAEATRRWFAGESDSAIRILEQLEGLARPGKHQGLAFVLIQKAGWLRELGRLNDARLALDEAEVLCAAMPAEVAPVCGLRMEQGIVARQAGDLPKAEAMLKDAQRLAMGSPVEVVMMSDILANLSSVYHDQGRLEEAQSALHHAIAYDRKTNDPRALASNLNMLGLLYDTAGDRKTARVYLSMSKDVATSASLAKEAADAAHNLAIISDQEGRTSEAKAGFLTALDSAMRSGRPAEIASSKTSLGILAQREGNFGEAREYLTGAYEIHSGLGLAEFCVNDLINLTQNQVSMKNPQAALEYARKALAMAEEHGLRQILWAAHFCVARARAAVLQQETSPDPKSLDEVLASYEKAADAIDVIRAGIGRPEERERLLVDKEMVYQEGMVLAGLLRKMTLAWTFAERSRGRAFLDSLGADRIGSEATKHPLAGRRAELTEQLLEMRDASGPEAQALSDELRLIRSRIIADAPAIAAVTEAELPTIEEVAAVIPDDTAIVEFFLGPGSFLTVFVLKQKGLAAMHTLDLGSADLSGLVEQFRAELQYEVPNEPTGELLLSVLLSPVWDAIDPVGRLFIVPHRELHYIPMAALWFSNSGEGPKRLYLCQRFLTTVVPSASYLVRVLKLQRTEAEAGQSLVMGNPTQDLPASEAEASAVSKLLGVSPVLGPEALRARVLDMSNRHAVIHIASHGVYEKRDPLLSGVLLADGRLSVEDLLDARIPANLLALSGCLTGLSAQGAGDELIGLAQAALAAGVPSVMTTLWEVPDDPTREFFERFYGNLREGMNKDEALALAQHSMLAEERYSRPSNWAPYVLLGDCR
jgi:CHAT domain-containing protein/tetratricopeptide (TPR) repeat protein